jgi:WD40 repeat protein
MHVSHILSLSLLPRPRPPPPPPPPSPARAQTFPDDSKTLVTASADTTCKMWDTETGVCYFTHQFEQPVRAVGLLHVESS